MDKPAVSEEPARIPPIMVDEADEAGVDVVVNAELVEWLQAYSVLGDNLKSGAEGATVPAAIWAQLQNGKGVATLVITMAAAQKWGKKPSFKLDSFPDGDAPELLAANWLQLEDLLMDKFKCELSKMRLVRISAWNTSEVMEVLNVIRARSGPPPAKAALGGVKPLSDDAGAEEKKKGHVARSDYIALAVALLKMAMSLYKILLATLLIAFIPRSSPPASCGPPPPPLPPPHPPPPPFQRWPPPPHPPHPPPSPPGMPGVPGLPPAPAGGASAQAMSIKATTVAAFRSKLVIEKVAVTFNFATFAVYILGEIFVFLREKFIVMHFSKDVSLPEDNLSNELQLYPGIRKHVRHWNRIVYFWSGLMLLMEIVNLILSLIALVQATHMGAGNAAVAQVFANVLLVIGQAFSYFRNSRRSFLNDGAVSCVTTSPNEGNTIDSAYKFVHGYYMPPEGASHHGNSSHHVGGAPAASPAPAPAPAPAQEP